MIAYHLDQIQAGFLSTKGEMDSSPTNLVEEMMDLSGFLLTKGKMDLSPTHLFEEMMDLSGFLLTKGKVQ